MIDKILSRNRRTPFKDDPNIDTFYLNTSGNKGIRYITSEKGLKEELEKINFPYRYLPLPRFTRKAPKNSATIFINKGDFYLEVDYPTMLLQAPNNIDFFVGAKAMLERLRQENGEYTLHSTTIGNKDGAVTLIGWKDSGKTGLSLQMCEEYKGYKILSEGKTVINNKGRVCGHIHKLENDNEFFRKKYGLRKEWCDLEKIVEVSKATPQIKLFIHPDITYSEVKTNKWDYDTSNFHLYEKLSSEIRNVFRRFRKYRNPIESLDTKKLANKRSKLCRMLAREVDIYGVKGRPKGICKKIDELFHKRLEETLLD